MNDFINPPGSDWWASQTEHFMCAPKDLNPGLYSGVFFRAYKFRKVGLVVQDGNPRNKLILRTGEKPEQTDCGHAVALLDG